MEKDGRLIRVGKYRGDANAVAFIVAISDPSEAVELIREKVAGPADEIQDLGRVSAALLTALALWSGEFIRTDGKSGAHLS